MNTSRIYSLLGMQHVRKSFLFKRLVFSLLFPLFLLSACTGSSSRASGQSANEETKSGVCYTAPVVPGVITDDYERGVYFMTHYWDQFQFEDTTCLHEEDLEQIFVDFVVPLSHMDPELAEKIIASHLTQSMATKESFEWFTSMYEKYLYEIGSPVRNEETYALVIENLLRLDGLDEVQKIRPQMLLEEINKNREGTKAADFTYLLPNGSKQRMHAFNAPYTLLFFYDPDCSICKAEKEKLMRSPLLLNWLDQKELRVLAICIGTEDDWKRHLSEYPAEWVNGLDANHAIISDELYLIKATPSMYLLDQNKTVLLKDVMADQLNEWLSEQV